MHLVTYIQAVFFDISKAFDRVWHNGLIRKVYATGILGPLLSWLRIYLTNKHQTVITKGEKSSYEIVPAGSLRALYWDNFILNLH